MLRYQTSETQHSHNLSGKQRPKTLATNQHYTVEGPKVAITSAPNSATTIYIMDFRLRNAPAGDPDLHSACLFTLDII